MKTITTHTDVYKFEELSDDAKQNALEHLSDINVDHDWWEFTYEDAERIGCKIGGFDIGRRDEIELTCKDAHTTAALIVEEHGETCDTWKLADEYLKDRAKVIAEAEADDGNRYEDGGLVDEPDFEDLDKEFVRALGEEYLSILRQEYEYLASEEAIRETIEANEYEFTEDGKMF